MNRDLALVFVLFVLVLASHRFDASFSDRIWNLHLRFALSKDSPEVNISDVSGNSMIILDAGNEKCMIQVGSLTKNGSIFKQMHFNCFVHWRGLGMLQDRNQITPC